MLISDFLELFFIFLYKFLLLVNNYRIQKLNSSKKFKHKNIVITALSVQNLFSLIPNTCVFICATNFDFLFRKLQYSNVTIIWINKESKKNGFEDIYILVVYYAYI